MEAGLFRDRTAIVTGGARGIGLACAARSPRAAGAAALWDRDTDRAKQSAAVAWARRVAVAGRCDQRRSDVAKALADTEEQLSPPDILVAERRHHRPQYHGGKLSGGCLAAGDRHQPDRRLPVQPRGRRRHGDARGAAASSTSPRWPAPFYFSFRGNKKAPEIEID